MSLEAIERITKLEETLRAEKADAQTHCRAMKEAALRAGEAHLVEVRRAAAQQEKELLAQAEQRAAEKGEKSPAPPGPKARSCGVRQRRTSPKRWN